MTRWRGTAVRYAILVVLLIGVVASIARRYRLAVECRSRGGVLVKAATLGRWACVQPMSR